MPAQDGQFIVDRYGRRLLDDQGRFMVHDSAAAPCCPEPGGEWCIPCEYDVPRAWIATFSGMDADNYNCIFLGRYPPYPNIVEIDGTLNASVRLPQFRFGGGSRCYWGAQYPREFGTSNPCDPNQLPYPGDLPRFCVKLHDGHDNFFYFWLARIWLTLSYFVAPPSQPPELTGYYWQLSVYLTGIQDSNHVCDPRVVSPCSPCLGSSSWMGGGIRVFANICNPSWWQQHPEVFPQYQQYRYQHPRGCLRELVLYDDHILPSGPCGEQADIYCSNAKVGSNAVATLQPEF